MVERKRLLNFRYSFKFTHSTSESIDFFQSIFYIQYSKTGNFYTFGINNNQALISQSLTDLSLLGEKVRFLQSLGM